MDMRRGMDGLSMVVRQALGRWGVGSHTDIFNYLTPYNLPKLNEYARVEFG
jgi:hypothetical protein